MLNRRRGRPRLISPAFHLFDFSLVLIVSHLNSLFVLAQAPSPTAPAPLRSLLPFPAIPGCQLGIGTGRLPSPFPMDLSNFCCFCSKESGLGELWVLLSLPVRVSRSGGVLVVVGMLAGMGILGEQIPWDRGVF